MPTEIQSALLIALGAAALFFFVRWLRGSRRNRSNTRRGAWGRRQDSDPYDGVFDDIHLARPTGKPGGGGWFADSSDSDGGDD